MNPHIMDEKLRQQERSISDKRFREHLSYDINSALWKSFEDVLRLDLDDLTLSVSNGNASFDEIRFMQGRMFEIIRLLRLRSDLLKP